MIRHTESKGWPLWGYTAVLLLMYALALTSMVQLAPTFDEQGFLVRGLGYLRAENQYMRVGHPLGLNALNAALLGNDPSVKLPTDDPSWLETGFHRPAELFLWEIGNDVEHIMFLARLPSIWLGLILAAIVGRWAWKMSGTKWAGLLALSLIALDPNILASTRLTTTDLGLALGAVLAGMLLWLFLRRPSWNNALIAGIGMGLLQNTKFTALLYIFLFALVILINLLIQWRTDSQHAFPWPTLLKLLTAYPLAAFLTLWAAYGFQIGTLPQELPTLPQLGGLTIPLSHHVEQFLDIGGRLQVETPSFLMGQYSRTGWWYYFPVAFLLKTPLPILILLPIASILRLSYYLKQPGPAGHTRRRDILNDTAVLIPALGYFAIALTSEINLGYRHLLPILPFLAVFTTNALASHHAQTAKNRLPLPKVGRRAIADYRIPLTAVILLSLLLVTLWIHPHYLSYFNLLAGGPDNGWRYLVDSNIDWGQDLNKLKSWLDENEVEQVWLSYFGEARPEYYGLNYQGLDSWPPRLMNPEARPYYPHDPAPGIYAISATNLQGVHFADHDQFAYFRERDPIAKIGYSIFLYGVHASGKQVDVVLAGVQLDEIAPQDYRQFNSNDIVPHWIDPSQAMILPDSTRRWFVLSKGSAVSAPFISLLESWPSPIDRDEYAIYQIPSLAVPDIEPITLFQTEDGAVRLMDAFIDTAVAGQILFLDTGWQQNGSPQPVKIFVHVLNKEGDLVAQWDGLGAEWEGWRPGDALLLRHNIPLPEGLPAGEYEIRAGLYHPETGIRWNTVDNYDYVKLGGVHIGE